LRIAAASFRDFGRDVWKDAVVEEAGRVSLRKVKVVFDGIFDCCVGCRGDESARPELHTFLDPCVDRFDEQLAVFIEDET
jgi:hypothetical protein